MARDPALLNRLTDYEVEYLVVGGVAALAHGSARFTETSTSWPPSTMRTPCGSFDHWTARTRDGV